MVSIPAPVLAALSRANAAHPWSHNDAHAGWILRQAGIVRRAGGRRALDIGCGTGGLVRRLAAVMPEVVGLEPDAATAELARRTTGDVRGTRIVEAGFGADGAPAGPFDLVVLVAVLHHLPLRPTLRALRSLVAPGGRLLVVGLADDGSGPVREVASMLLNPVVGMLRHPRRAVAAPPQMTAPTADPGETLDEIRAAFAAELPGARLRPTMFWRYRAVWVAPGGSGR